MPDKSLGTSTGLPDPPPELIEKLRQSGITIDREGRFIHEGEPVRHEGLKRALFRWLDRLPPPDGRYILRLDERRYAYVDVEDTPLVAASLRWAGDRALIALSDGSEEALDPETLTMDAGGVLRCRARGGRLEARLGSAAAATLAERVEETPEGPVLKASGQRWVIGRS